MPGFLPFMTGVLLFMGLAWFESFNEKPLYMTAMAFTAYGVHWWAIGIGRVFGSDPRPNALMSIPFLCSPRWARVEFFGADDNPVGGLFVGPAVVYICDFFASLGSPLGATSRRGSRRHRAVAQLLTVAAVLNIARGFNLPL